MQNTELNHQAALFCSLIKIRTWSYHLLHVGNLLHIYKIPLTSSPCPISVIVKSLVIVNLTWRLLERDPPGIIKSLLDIVTYYYYIWYIMWYSLQQWYQTCPAHRARWWSLCQSAGEIQLCQSQLSPQTKPLAVSGTHSTKSNPRTRLALHAHGQNPLAPQARFGL